MNNIKKNVSQKRKPQKNLNYNKKKVVISKNKINKSRIRIDKPKKKLKIKYGKVLLFLVFLIIFIYLLIRVLNLPIKNIFICGNTIYSDQEIIEMAKLDNYPSTFSNLSLQISLRLEKNIYIKKANVIKKGLFNVYINIEENYPLFYSIPKNKTILKDFSEVNGYIKSPTLVNLVSDDVYQKFILKMQTVNKDILERISEIQYAPNNADNTRFMFKMTDGNYIYINYAKFKNINDYLDIIKLVNGKKGIFNLDAGNSFEIKE